MVGGWVDWSMSDGKCRTPFDGMRHVLDGGEHGTDGFGRDAKSLHAET